MNAKQRSMLLINGGLLLILLPVFFILSTGHKSQPPVVSNEESDIDLDQTTKPILDAVDEYGSLTVLSSLLKESGMDEELTGEGPFTLFAPDDSAFSQLQPAQLEKLTSDREYLREVLARHIVAGHRVEFGEETESLTIKTINGELLTAEITNEAVKVEQAWIIDEQLECSNGVIHVIDGVLLPQKGKHKG